MKVESPPRVLSIPRRHGRIPSTPAPQPATTPSNSRFGRLVQWCLRAQQLPARRLEGRDWLYLTSAFLLSRGAILLLGVLGTAMFPAVGPNQS